MIKKILSALGLLLAAIAIYAVLKPAEYLIKRDITINAKPEAIYPYLVNMKNADKWMPWREIDPQVQSTYTGPEEGVGATSNWNSQGQMGTGKAEIISATQNQSVQTKITYTKPMEMNQDSEFVLIPDGEDTKMTWSVTGKNPFFMRLMCILMFRNMDQFVGGMFERGLVQLKTMVETQK